MWQERSRKRRDAFLCSIPVIAVYFVCDFEIKRDNRDFPKCERKAGEAVGRSQGKRQVEVPKRTEADQKRLRKFSSRLASHNKCWDRKKNEGLWTSYVRKKNFLRSKISVVHLSSTGSSWAEEGGDPTWSVWNFFLIWSNFVCVCVCVFFCFFPNSLRWDRIFHFQKVPADSF